MQTKPTMWRHLSLSHQMFCSMESIPEILSYTPPHSTQQADKRSDGSDSYWAGLSLKCNSITGGLNTLTIQQWWLCTVATSTLIHRTHNKQYSRQTWQNEQSDGNMSTRTAEMSLLAQWPFTGDREYSMHLHRQVWCRLSAKPYGHDKAATASGSFFLLSNKCKKPAASKTDCSPQLLRNSSLSSCISDKGMHTRMCHASSPFPFQGVL